MAPMKSLLAGLALAASSLLPAQAGVVYSDTSLSNWSSSLILGGSCPGLSTVAQASGGNGGAFLQYTQQACNQMMAGHLSTFTWDPSTQGAIASMDVSFDADWLAGAFQGDTRMGLNALLRQNGVDYVAMYHEVSAQPWSHFSATLTAGDWCTVGGCTAAHPDFTAAGGLISFGIATSNNCPGCGKTLSGGLDNYELTINTRSTGTVPEPGSLALAGLAAGAMALLERRRRRRG